MRRNLWGHVLGVMCCCRAVRYKFQVRAARGERLGRCEPRLRGVSEVFTEITQPFETESKSVRRAKSELHDSSCASAPTLALQLATTVAALTVSTVTGTLLRGIV